MDGPHARGTRNAGGPQTLQCANCNEKIGVPQGAKIVKCPKCAMSNGVPYHYEGYGQDLGQEQAAVVNEPAPQPTGRKKALLIGCNYPGTSAQLSGCINDVSRMNKMLTTLYSFPPGSIRILTDDGRSRDGLPTRANITEGMRWLTQGAQPGDVLFFHFSGHGGQEEDPTYTEEDGYDETLCPTDFQIAGQIVDTEVLDTLCMPLPAGVKVTAVLDCCHSGTGMDLPFSWMGGMWQEGRWQEETNPCFCAADVQMISGCEDVQCSSDASDRYGQPAGALTSALCDTLEARPVQPYPDLLQGIYQNLQQNGHSQRPQLTSSQAFDMKTKPWNPCGDIVANKNRLLGRQFRKAKHPHRDFGGGFGNMLGSDALLMGAVLPMFLDSNDYGGIMPGFDMDIGDMFGGGDGDLLNADGGGDGGGGGFGDFFGGLLGGDGGFDFGDFGGDGDGDGGDGD
mmetsp:Transcript_107480/g.213427  ORF Transcript_107480/g.213427 Transcript_107480/m.213427 type:complete len:453 (+) Transcript_107480:3-1361(+)